MNKDIDWITSAVPLPSEQARERAKAHQQQLTKPLGSLGLLEEIAIQMAAIQGVEKPIISNPSMSIFAGDHGVTAEGISAFPQEVTGQMILNFAQGGAAICRLCAAQDIRLEVINTGCVFTLPPVDNVIDAQIAPSTANLAKEAAMSATQLAQALRLGKEAAERANERGSTLFMVGEMGIGNTTPAAAMSCALLGAEAEAMCGRGTGLDKEGVAHKVAIVKQALNRAKLTKQSQPLEVLTEVGGFEIAAMSGAYIRGAQLGLTMIVDGFIATSAAIAAVRINSKVRDYLLFAHQSGEQAHQQQLEFLQAKPIYRLGMRLGEGSGAALAVNTVKLALELHNSMATFAQAGVSDG